MVSLFKIVMYIGRACYMGGWQLPPSEARWWDPKGVLPQSKWHNPYTIKEYGEQAILMYEQYIRGSPLMNDIEELRGKRLGCWFSPALCHGDVLIKILNERLHPGYKYLTLNIIG